LNASVNDAAADTVTLPDTLGAAAVVVVDADFEPLLPHPVATSPPTTTSTTAHAFLDLLTRSCPRSPIVTT